MIYLYSLLGICVSLGALQRLRFQSKESTKQKYFHYCGSIITSSVFGIVPFISGYMKWIGLLVALSLLFIYIGIRASSRYKTVLRESNQGSNKQKIQYFIYICRLAIFSGIFLALLAIFVIL